MGNPTVMIVAGEASGDMHGAALVGQLRIRNQNVEIFGIGLEALKREGVDIVYDASEISVMGFSEVISKLPRVMTALRTARREMVRRRPDVIVLVDFPGFNLKIARLARKLGVKVAYYISPQVWAWGSWRIRTLAAAVDRMIVILPFEEEIYRKAGIDAVFVGHPLMETIDARNVHPLASKSGGSTLGLLPGSRIQEVKRLLPSMLSVAECLMKKTDDLRVLVSRSEALPRDLYDSAGRLGEACEVVSGNSRGLMASSDAILVASGTATLEAAILGVPMVVMYKVSPLSAAIARVLVRIPNVALVNVVAGRRIVPEFVQGSIDTPAIEEVAGELLLGGQTAQAMKMELAGVVSSLGSAGASSRAAGHVLDLIET
jgi:lipid-A-disaccharide synthase